MGPREHGDNGGVAGRERRSSVEEPAEAKRSTLGGCAVLFKKMGGTWNCIVQREKRSASQEPTRITWPRQSASRVCPASSIQHPASINPARQPCAAWGGLPRGRAAERGPAASDAPGHWARATHRGRGSHRGSDLSGRQHRRGGGGVVTGGSVLKPFTDQASLWAAQPLSRRPQHPVLPDSGAECLAMRPHKPKAQASWEHRWWACEHCSYFKHSRCPQPRGCWLRDCGPRDSSGGASMDDAVRRSAPAADQIAHRGRRVGPDPRGELLCGQCPSTLAVPGRALWQCVPLASETGPRLPETGSVWGNRVPRAQDGLVCRHHLPTN